MGQLLFLWQEIPDPITCLPQSTWLRIWLPSCQFSFLFHQHSGRHGDDLENAALIVVSGFLLPERPSFPLFTRSVSNFLLRSFYFCYLHSPTEFKLQLLQNHLPFIKTFFKSCSLSHTYFYSLPYKITFVEHLPHARPKWNSFHKCSHFPPKIIR